MSQADGTIMTCAFITMGSTVGSDVMPKKYGGRATGFDFRHIVGGMAAFTMLLVMARFAPSLASAFAVMAAVIAFLYNGAPLLGGFLYKK